MPPPDIPGIARFGFGKSASVRLPLGRSDAGEQRWRTFGGIVLNEYARARGVEFSLGMMAGLGLEEC